MNGSPVVLVTIDNEIEAVKFWLDQADDRIARASGQRDARAYEIGRRDALKDVMRLLVSEHRRHQPYDSAATRALREAGY